MTFWNGPTLEARLPELIEPFQIERIDCASYTLSVGNQIYVTPDEEMNVRHHTKQELEPNQPFTIPPGQFGFLLTVETVKVPQDSIAFISIKASWKFRGLINVSGFHVDPGYRGRLVFSVFNAGPQPIHLQQGMELFLIWFAHTGDNTEKYVKHGEGYMEIKSSLINGISGPVYSLQGISGKYEKLTGSISRIGESLSYLKWVIAVAVIPLYLAIVIFALRLAWDNIENWVDGENDTPTVESQTNPAPSEASGD